MGTYGQETMPLVALSLWSYEELLRQRDITWHDVNRSAGHTTDIGQAIHRDAKLRLAEIERELTHRRELNDYAPAQPAQEPAQPAATNGGGILAAHNLLRLVDAVYDFENAVRADADRETLRDARTAIYTAATKLKG